MIVSELRPMTGIENSSDVLGLKSYVAAVEGKPVGQKPANYLSLQQSFRRFAQTSQVQEVAAIYLTDQRETVIPLRTTHGTKDLVTPPLFSITDIETLVEHPKLDTCIVFHSHPFHLLAEFSDADMTWFQAFSKRMQGHLKDSVFNQPVPDQSLFFYSAAGTLTDHYVWQGVHINIQLAVK